MPMNQRCANYNEQLFCTELSTDNEGLVQWINCNPFDLVNTLLPSCQLTRHSSYALEFDPTLTRLLQSYISGESSTTAEQLPMPGCFATTIFPWIRRILGMMARLPSASRQALEILTGISNLYLTTAFRMASGSSKNERLLLGMDSPAPTIQPEMVASISGSRAAVSQGSSTIFAFGRRQAPVVQSSSSAVSMILPTTTDAEICSPLASEFDEIRTVQTLIFKAQHELKSIAKLDLVDQWIVDPTPSTCRSLAELACNSARVLEKRQLSIWGCAFLALTIEIALNIMVDRDLADGNRLEEFATYVRAVTKATPKLIEIGSRLSCIRAIRGRIIVQQVSSSCLSEAYFPEMLTSPPLLDFARRPRVGRGETARPSKRIRRIGMQLHGNVVVFSSQREDDSTWCGRIRMGARRRRRLLMLSGRLLESPLLLDGRSFFDEHGCGVLRKRNPRSGNSGETTRPCERSYTTDSCNDARSDVR